MSKDKDARLKWLKDLHASGYAGIDNNTGEVVDRREHLDAAPIPENKAMGTAAPKPTSKP